MPFFLVRKWSLLPKVPIFETFANSNFNIFHSALIFTHMTMEYGKVDGQTVAHLCEQRCHWRGAQWGKRNWCEIRLLWLLTNLSFLAVYFAGRGMVDGSNKRWDGRKKIVLFDYLFSLSFCIHLLSFQVRPFSVHFAYQSVPFWRLLFSCVWARLLCLVVFFESPGPGVHVKFC